jgi:chromosome segregation ATPase
MNIQSVKDQISANNMQTQQLGRHYENNLILIESYEKEIERLKKINREIDLNVAELQKEEANLQTSLNILQASETIDWFNNSPATKEMLKENENR